MKNNYKVQSFLDMDLLLCKKNNMIILRYWTLQFGTEYIDESRILLIPSKG